jgi:hypothetical protein
MGDVRIIAGIFGNANFHPICRHLAMRDFEDRPFAFGQGDLHLVQLRAAP